MTRSIRSRFCPEVETLDERALPNNFSNLGADALGIANQALANAAVAAANSQNQGNNPGVLPPQSHVYGASEAEWSARWWQYAFSVDADHSPFTDGTGKNFAAGQSGKVWYLAGSFASYDPITGAFLGGATADNPAVVTRSVTLPEGTALFFPILNAEWDNINPGGPDHDYTVDQMRAFTKEEMDSVTGMELDIDGVQIQNLAQYRTVSPVFSYHAPANNIYGSAVGERDVSPAVSDGYYVMTAPLSAGQHTIHFTGTIPASDLTGPGYGEDITYHITVTHHGK